MAWGTTAVCPVCDERLVVSGGLLNPVVECFCAQRGYSSGILTAVEMHIAHTSTHCGVCACEIKTVSASNEPHLARATERTRCRCCVNTYTATYATLRHEPNTFKIMHGRAALEQQRRKMNAEAFCGLPNGYKVATRQDVVDALHKPPTTTIQRAAEALADGLATLCDPHRDPWCIRCERQPAPNPDGLCADCYPTLHSYQRESMARTIGAGKFLPRPGAIVLAVDDPNGDDVGEDV